MEKIFESIPRLEPPKGHLDLNRFWKMILYSDGSMTRNLEALTQSPVSIELLAENEIKDQSDLKLHYPNYFFTIRNPVIERRVILKNSKSEILMKATSLWNAEDYGLIMKDKSAPIGNNINGQKHEYFREILHVNLLISEERTEPFKFRSYYLYHNNKPLTYIEETFLPDGEKYLDDPSKN